MAREKITIGRYEYIWIVLSSQKKIPARIDTGARTTAIWASDILEKNGKVFWKFFDRDSEFYNGETFSTEHFEKRIVQSSTGHQQARYLIPITLQIKKRRVRTYATLADRSHATFPILIGRNTLNGKFVVDVAHGSRKLSDLDRAGFYELQGQIHERTK